MSDIYLTYFLLVVLACITSIPLWVYLRSEHRDLFEPIYLSTAYFSLLFIVRAIFDLILGSDFIGPAPLDEPTAIAFNKGLLYLIPCLIVFFIGYYSRIGRAVAILLPNLPTTWSTARFRLFAPVFILVGILSYYLLVRYFGGWYYYINNKREIMAAGGPGYYLTGVSLLLQVFIVGLTVALGTGKERLFTYIIMLPVVLLIGFFSGAKGQFMLPILAGLVCINYLRKKVRPRILVLIAALYILIIAPVFNMYRAIDDVSKLKGSVGDFAGKSNSEILARQSMSRFYGVDSVAIIIRDTPDVMDYQAGATLIPVALFWIPRQVWPDKPVVSFGKVFGETYMHDWFPEGGIAASPTILGEGYINWHVSGMLWLSLLSGVFLRTAYEYLIKRNLGGPAVYIFSYNFLYLFMFWEVDFTIISVMVVNIVTGVIMVMLMGKKQAGIA